MSFFAHASELNKWDEVTINKREITSDKNFKSPQKNPRAAENQRQEKLSTRRMLRAQSYSPPRHKYVQTKMTHGVSQREEVLFTPEKLEITFPLSLFCSPIVGISKRLLTLLCESIF